MKAFIVSSLVLVSTMSFAQSIDLKGVKSLMAQRQAILEKVYPGMSKKITTLVKYPTEIGPCEVTEIAVQTVMRIEGDKIIVHSKESYMPAKTPACEGFESQEVAVLFHEAKPSLALDLEDLDESEESISSILRAGEIVTMILSASGETVTVKYDLSKPSFKSLVLTQDSAQTVTSLDIADINPSTINLRKVLFCESAESQNCSEGDYSDILF